MARMPDLGGVIHCISSLCKYCGGVVVLLALDIGMLQFCGINGNCELDHDHLKFNKATVIRT